MSETVSNTSAPAGWYPEPTGGSTLRWWDGSTWTNHVHDPAVEIYGAAPATVVGPQTPVYNVFIWLLVLLPLVSVIIFVSWDPTFLIDNLHSSQATLQYQQDMLADPRYWFSVVTGWAATVGSVLFSYLDFRILRQLGFVRPFHWAWSFLLPAIYVIGRSIVVSRQAGRGRGIIRVLVAVFAFAVVAFTIKLALIFSQIVASHWGPGPSSFG